MNETITVDGQEYEVLQRFSEKRVLVNMEGLAALADNDGVEWLWSGEPARDGAEKDAVMAHTKALEERGTQVVVTKDE